MVYACVRKRQTVLSVCDFKLTWHPEYFEPLSGEFYGVWRQINSDIVRSVPRKLDPISSYSTPDFKHTFPTKRVELGNHRHVPFPTLKPFSGNFLKISTPLRLLGEARLARICIPETSYVGNIC